MVSLVGGRCTIYARGCVKRWAGGAERLGRCVWRRYVGWLRVEVGLLVCDVIRVRLVGGGVRVSDSIAFLALVFKVVSIFRWVCLSLRAGLLVVVWAVG